jgi:phosphoglycolate phosphatase
MNKVRAVIFDMDGTVLNTIEDLTIATNHALLKNGLPEVTVEEEYYFVGNGLYTTAKRSCGEGVSDEVVQKVYEDLLTFYRAHSEDHTAPYEGVVDVIRKLRKQGIKTAVVSNKADIAVQNLVTKFFADCFDGAMGETEGFALKPDKAMVEEMLKRLDISKEEAVYVGDSNVDLKTAENSGLPCIAVSWGFRGRAKLEEYGAKTIIDQPEELLRIVDCS